MQEALFELHSFKKNKLEELQNCLTEAMSRNGTKWLLYYSQTNLMTFIDIFYI